MALHGSNTGLLIDGFDMSAYFHEFAMESSQAMHDATVFGNSSRVKVPGLKDGKANGDAFFDPTATVGSYPVLKARYSAQAPGVSSPASVSMAPAGFTLANRVAMGYFDTANFNFKSIIDGLEMLVFTGESDQDAIDYGVSLHALIAEAATGNGTAVDNAAATSNGGVGTLHVPAIAGAAPSVVVTLEHSTDNSTWVTLVTFVASTVANTAQRIEVAAGTTVRRYLRAVRTFGGTTTSITFQSSFARR